MTTQTEALPLARRPVRDTGLQVSVLGMGTAPLGNLFARLDEASAVDSIVTAIQGGINLIDTSPWYGLGLAELRVGTATRRAARGREDLVISTKVGRWMNPMASQAHEVADVAAPGWAAPLNHHAVLDYSYDGTLRSIEQSLLRTGLDRIDLALIHDVDVWTHGEAAIEELFSQAMNGAYRALHRLREEGVVKGIGIGVNEAEMCERFAQAGDFDAMMLAGRYSLLEQPALDSFLPLAEKKRIAMLLGGVFNSGILATGAVAGARYNYREAPVEIVEKVRAIERVCAAHQVRLADASLQFALAHPAVGSLVLGAVTPKEVLRNIESVQSEIPEGLWSDLRLEGLLPSHAPTPCSAVTAP
ncbi:aldo/keto reductase [Variovorax boronicumulans]|uniref:aldo/keto reductase n=1 Tax=Variovorax boronicumulans TaxID=436515 RepID=UPI00214B9601